MGCNRDKKHCCFHWELNYGLNTGLKQSWYVYGTIKGSISSFRIIFFHPFSFFSRLRFPPCPPFDITQVIWVLVIMSEWYMKMNCSWRFFCDLKTVPAIFGGLAKMFLPFFKTAKRKVRFIKFPLFQPVLWRFSNC